MKQGWWHHKCALYQAGVLARKVCCFLTKGTEQCKCAVCETGTEHYKCAVCEAGVLGTTLVCSS
jgi:hypothetical protein